MAIIFATMGRLDLVTNLSDLQRSLRPQDLVRDFGQYCELFERAGVNLQAMIFDGLMAEKFSTEAFRVVDVGSCSGNAIEQVARMIKSWMHYMGIQRPFDAVGIDNHLVTKLDPAILSTGSDIGLTQDPLARFVQADATNPAFDDDSVDVLFSCNTLMYVADSLKALEEGYRALKPGGVAAWDGVDKNISFKPSFAEILAATEGAKEVFTYIPVNSTSGVIVCRKSKDGAKFRGFSFKLAQPLRYRAEDDPTVSANAVHARTAIYRILDNPDAAK